MAGLADAQRQFTFMLAQLIQYAYSNGMPVRVLCGKCVKEGHHRENSLHYDGLAVDLALDLLGPDGKWYYTDRTQDHKKLGTFWETIGGTWGGHFGETSPNAGDGSDGNHYSKSYQGRM